MSTSVDDGVGLVNAAFSKKDAVHACKPTEDSRHFQLDLSQFLLPIWWVDLLSLHHATLNNAAFMPSVSVLTQMSRERVRQIENRALLKLRWPACNGGAYP